MGRHIDGPWTVKNVYRLSGPPPTLRHTNPRFRAEFLSQYTVEVYPRVSYQLDVPVQPPKEGAHQETH